MLKGRTQSVGVVLTQKLEVLNILKGDARKFKRGDLNSLTLSSREGGGKKFQTRNFPFCSLVPLSGN